MKRLLGVVILVWMTIHTFSQERTGPYHPEADVRADLKSAVVQARAENKHVLVQFGGNWCPWCIRFHQLVEGAPQVDSLVTADYIYLLANVPGKKDQRDYALLEEYGFPNRFGFPVFVILDGNGNQLHIQDSGILEHCTEKGYDTTKVVTFLRMWNVSAMDPTTYMK
ncbi:MAG: thioredoxin family protein [Bacteroidales bacterium]|nr:thioredoxin family protein [Bacteroidales bacterium]